MPEVEQAFEGIEVDAPRVGIIMGSESDKPAMEPAGKELRSAASGSRCGCCRRIATRRRSPTTRATPTCAGCG